MPLAPEASRSRQRGVNFQPDDLGDLQGITKQFANALQVIEERGTVSVALTAVSNGCR